VGLGILLRATNAFPCAAQLVRPPHAILLHAQHNSPGLTMQSLVEIFRTAHEVDSAEFVLVDDGSAAGMAQLEQFVERLKELFGTACVWVRNATPRGFSEVGRRHSGMHACRQAGRQGMHEGALLQPWAQLVVCCIQLIETTSHAPMPASQVRFPPLSPGSQSGL
jgi:hypothetical protein